MGIVPSDLKRGIIMAKIDGRTREGREARGIALASRLNKETVLECMPKLYYVEDGDRVRLGRTDWAGDVFNLVPKSEFAVFKRIYEEINMPLIDLTWDDDGAEWDKVRS
jgi:hypothetical protein